MKSVSIIGTGNVASVLTAKFKASKKIDVKSVCSNNLRHANQFSQQFEIPHYTNKPNNILPADFIIVAVKDNVLKDVVKQLPHFKQAVYCHTAGSFGLDVFHDLPFQNIGVFYPLQSLSKNELLEAVEIPILLEAESQNVYCELQKLAFTITNIVENISFKKRKELHVAAVMVNNFVNYIVSQSQNYCQQQNLDFNLLKPLFEHTAQRILAAQENVWKYQTGPAVRNDKDTIEKHLEILANFPELKQLYQFLTRQIIKQAFNE